MTPERWRNLLATWSREILAVEEYRNELAPEVVASGWLGFPGATEEEIAQAEARLGVALPRSYRSFLTVTNGWRRTTQFIERIRPVSEIGWYRDEDPETVTSWREETPEGQAGLHETLAISVGENNEQHLLLNPTQLGPDGEWEGWFFAFWVPGAHRYDSFWGLMQAEHESFLYVEQSQRERGEKD